ncbi:hypothetical protein EXIGLDRAFT_748565 [Exidia glandulosa HHB12029]|uniref:RED-like N-terminal domain-containing protein n=1 Tax=Exidia glandulosa HHB12029 TaxID=1314781 RepID=A0A165JB02_EXIGL|nr:hypothetical protein EXIGLDRAFT_748565 [Exidia glandulosa HHB12029]
MDQDAFRKILTAPRPAGAASKTGTSSRRTVQTVDASQPIFKPRKAATTKPNPKKTDIGFKEGGSSTLRALIEEYDDAPPPVNGLDFALLEKEKAKLAGNDDDMDDVLEATYKTVASTSVPAAAPKKRTREEILNELKAKRQKTDTDSASPPVDDVKKTGKFRPIGAPPPKEKKKEKLGADGMPKKKKRKLEAAEQPEGPSASTSTSAGPAPAVPPSNAAPPPQAQPDEEEDAFGGDIFADVEEYKGFDDEDDSDDNSGAETSKPAEESTTADALPAAPTKWFQLDDEEGEIARPPTPPPAAPVPEAEREASPEPVRLAPLASSSFSIKDVLAMDKELEKDEKRRAKKEKKKKGELPGEGGGGREKPKMSAEAKATRDLQKLESYQKKRGG